MVVVSHLFLFLWIISGAGVTQTGYSGPYLELSISRQSPDPPDQRGKEGDANVCYISGLSPDWNIHCSPCKSDLSDAQGKKIAATTSNSDG